MFRPFRILIYFSPIILIFLFSLWLHSGLPVALPELLPNQVNKPVPEFHFPDLIQPEKQINQKLFLGHITLLNVFSSSCAACVLEHPLLMDIAKQHSVQMMGLNYKDERSKALDMLEHAGNPYQWIAFDPNGTAASLLAVHSMPQTDIIDAKGHIRYQLVGPLDEEIWHTDLLPLIKKLRAEMPQNHASHPGQPS